MLKTSEIGERNEKKETYWSRFAEDFEKRQSFVAGEEMICLVKEELQKEEKLGHVLELGCGTGLYTEVLKDNSEFVLATDFSDEMIEASKKLRGGYQNVKFLKADAMNLNFDEESFDTIVMINLIHVISDPERVINESSRVLKSGGKILIASFALDEMNLLNKIRTGNRYLRTFGRPPSEASKSKNTRIKVETMLNDSGFSHIKSKVLGDKMRSIYVTGEKIS
ncbi:MAG: class I SAM-dependent methyltransferase [Halobacteriota archaeon]|nr:class I SAM-dependent methyltransferase [Halobacteriota archaeon]